MKRLLSFVLITFCYCYMMGQQLPDTASVVGRLQYVYVLKKVINNRVWPGFADKENDVPLIYDFCFFIDEGLPSQRCKKVKDRNFYAPFSINSKKKYIFAIVFQITEP